MGLDTTSTRPSPAPPTDYLSVKQAAAVLGVSTHFIYDRVGKRSGPPYRKRGTKLIFPRDEFMRWADQKIIP